MQIPRKLQISCKTFSALKTKETIAIKPNLQIVQVCKDKNIQNANKS